MQQMSQVSRCNMSACGYNTDNLCHTPGITVGPHAECNTFNHANPKGGFREANGGVGACIASECAFNEQLECKAPNIAVASHTHHADCATFKQRK